VRALIKEICTNYTKYVFDGNSFELFRVTDEEKYNNWLKEDVEIKSKDKLPNTLSKVVLNMSNACNLRCKYCYADHGGYGRSNALMQKETLMEVIAYLERANIKKIGILSFFGGEPLLNFDLIRDIVPVILSKFDIDNFEIVTNGTMLTEEIVKFLVQYNFVVGVSIDGPADITDLLRGKDTHKSAINAIRLCKASGLDKLTASVTYTGMHEEFGYSIEDVKNYISELGIRYTFSRAKTLDESLKVKRIWTFDDVERDIRDSLRDIYENKINTCVNYYVNAIAMSLFLGARSESFCDELSEGNSISFDYDGTPYSCFFFWGNDKLSGKWSNNLEISKYNDKNNYEACKDCWAKNMCKLCIASIINRTETYPFSDGICADKRGYELALTCVIEYINANNHIQLAGNFVKSFLMYR